MFPHRQRQRQPFELQKNGAVWPNQAPAEPLTGNRVRKGEPDGAEYSISGAAAASAPRSTLCPVTGRRRGGIVWGVGGRAKSGGASRVMSDVEARRAVYLRDDKIDAFRTYIATVGENNNTIFSTLRAPPLTGQIVKLDCPLIRYFLGCLPTLVVHIFVDSGVVNGNKLEKVNNEVDWRRISLTPCCVASLSCVASLQRPLRRIYPSDNPIKAHAKT